MKTAEYILEESMRYRATDLNSMSDTARIIRAMEEYHFQFKSQPSGKEPTEEAILGMFNKYTTTSIDWLFQNHHQVLIDPMDYHKIAKELFSLFAGHREVTDEEICTHDFRKIEYTHEC